MITLDPDRLQNSLQKWFRINLKVIKRDAGEGDVSGAGYAWGEAGSKQGVGGDWVFGGKFKTPLQKTKAGLVV